MAGFPIDREILKKRVAVGHYTVVFPHAVRSGKLLRLSPAASPADEGWLFRSNFIVVDTKKKGAVKQTVAVTGAGPAQPFHEHP